MYRLSDVLALVGFSNSAIKRRKILNLTGIMPRTMSIYNVALRHISMSSDTQVEAYDCNERLEFLGDSVLGTVISEYLYKKFPTKDEGFLTDMKSKLVSRKTLNDVGYKLGLNSLIEYDKNNLSSFNQSMYGNTLEALIGAIYLDLGLQATRKFILKRIIRLHIDLEKLEMEEHNFKGQLLELAQKGMIEMPTFVLLSEDSKNNKVFHIGCKIGGITLGKGMDKKKKHAEQKASQEALTRIIPKLNQPDKQIKEETQFTFQVS